MTPSLNESRRFLRLAGDDLAAFRALATIPHIRQALAFFHAPQAIEKSLKAVLFAQGVEFRYGDEVIPTLGSEEVDAIAAQMLDWAAAVIAGMEP